MPDEYQQYDRVIATFSPTRTDDLKDDAAPIGWRGEWRALWIIETGPYEGQWAFLPMGASYAWAPQCDLVDVERAMRLSPAAPPGT